MPTFPYDPDWGRPGTYGKRVLSSVAVSGARKSRSKSSKKRSFELHFETRDATEFAAVVTFWDTNYPGITITYTDNTVSPAASISCEIVSDLAFQNNGYNDIDYWFQVLET